MSTINVEGAEVEETAIVLRLGRASFVRLCDGEMPVRSIWLTEQPDGSFALGVTTEVPPDELGYQARRVEVDDRVRRFGGPATTPSGEERFEVERLSAESHPLRMAYVRLVQSELALHLAALDEPRLEEGDWLTRTLEPVVRAKRQVERAALSLGVDLVNEEG